MFPQAHRALSAAVEFATLGEYTLVYERPEPALQPVFVPEPVSRPAERPFGVVPSTPAARAALGLDRGPAPAPPCPAAGRATPRPAARVTRTRGGQVPSAQLELCEAL